MDISKDQLLSAAKDLGISRQQAEELWDALSAKETRDSFPKLLYYFGAVIILAGMAWFLGRNWLWFGGLETFFTALLYAIFFLVVGAKLWKREDFKTPAGLLITLAVFMVPLAIYGLQTYFDFWPSYETGPINRDVYTAFTGSWIFMELGTIAAGFIALLFFGFHMITVPIYIAAWFLAVDGFTFILGNQPDWMQTSWIAIIYGLVVTAIGFFLDRNREYEFGFWGYFFGTLALWIGLTSLMVDKGQSRFFAYFVINLVFIFAGVALQRRILLILGGIGIFLYLGNLAYVVFKDSILFPFALSIVGILIMYLGLLYHKHTRWIEQKISAILPRWLQHKM